MDKKKILIVSRSFYPENSPRSNRTTELAKEFALQGHKVTVLTPKKTDIHSSFEKEHNLTIKDLGTPRWKNPDFGKSRMGYLLTRAASRFLSLAFEYPSIELMFLVSKALKKENEYDLLISIAVPYPIHWGVATIWNKNQAIAKTWVADCGDPYMGCETDSFKKWFYFKYVEKWFMRKADAITIPVESARSAYYKQYHNKIHVIPQGFKIKPIETNKTSENKIISFAYAGGFIPEIRDPRSFLDYLSRVQGDFIFYIFTNNTRLIERFKSELGDKLQIKSYIPREELIRFLSTMDFVVNFDNNTGAAVPSKLIDYKIVNKPVLNIKKELDIKTIQDFFIRDYRNAMKIDSIDQYRIENVCAQFLELTEQK